MVYELASKFDLADNSTKEFFHQTKFFDFSGNQINNDISVALTTAFYSIMNTDLKDVDEKSLKGSIGEYFEVKYAFKKCCLF